MSTLVKIILREELNNICINAYAIFILKDSIEYLNYV